MNMNYPNPIELLGQAAVYTGTKEISGAKHNPVIVEMLRYVGIRWGGDETPWCAAFVNWVLENAGVDGTGSAMARSFMRWGEDIPFAQAKPGDIVVLWRKSKTSASGHVGFLQAFEGRYIRILGGNQGNRVSSKRYPLRRLLSVRRQTGNP